MIFLDVPVYQITDPIKYSTKHNILEIWCNNMHVYADIK